MEVAKQWITVPLSSLVASPRNVRRHTATHIEELAALIDSQGLLQNLVVTEAGTGRRKARAPRFAVAAGERRRRAMLLLHERGRLAADHEVRCELVSPERGLEVSLAENSGREAEIAAALDEAGCESSPRETAALKKGELVAVAAARLAGRSWLPTLLRSCTAE